jgi:hypothetical protein
MPFVVLVVMAFIFAIVFGKGASKRMYAFFAMAAVVATVYYFAQ